MAEKIFRPDVGTCKGNITRRKQISVVDDPIEIPVEFMHVHEDVVIKFD